MDLHKIFVSIDSDGVIADLVPAWCAAYNKEWDDNLEPEVFGASWSGIDKIVKPECGAKVYKLLEADGFFNTLSPMPCALEELEKLFSNTKLFPTIVTAYSGHPEIAKGKVQWYQENAPFVDKDYITMTHEKYLVYCNVLIDDSEDNLREFLEFQDHIGNDNIHALAMAAPHNENLENDDRIIRIQNMAEAVDYIDNIVL